MILHVPDLLLMSTELYSVFNPPQSAIQDSKVNIQLDSHAHLLALAVLPFVLL